MKLLTQRIDGIGIDPERMTVVGRVGMSFVESRKHYSGSMVDAYRPSLVRLAIEVDDAVVAEIAAGSREFAEAANTLKQIRRLPLFEMLTEVCKPLQQEGQDFRLAWQEMIDLVRAEALFLEGIVDDSDEKSDEAAWIRFRYTLEFKDAPCSRSEFDEIWGEFKTSKFVASMGVDQYYAWWRRSQTMMDGEALTDSALAQAGRMLEVWRNDNDPGSLKYWLCRNLEVHPRHRLAFERLVDERLAARVVDGPSTPNP
jgi:Arc/MetJ family transcription regulator